MHERYLGRIEPGMDVCDVSGEKFGTVARVYRYDPSLVGTTGRTERPPLDEIVEIKTGFLGLGKHLYLPMGAIQDVTSGCIFLSKARESVDTAGWDQKPAYFDELS